MCIQNEYMGRAWWLMRVIPALWEAKVGPSPEIGSSRPACPTWGNPVSTKNTKKISQAWWHTPVIPATPEAEVAVQWHGHGSLKPQSLGLKPQPHE